MTRICMRLSGLSRSQSRRLELRFRPSHSSPVPAGRPVSGSVAGGVVGFLVRIMKYTEVWKIESKIEIQDSKFGLLLLLHPANFAFRFSSFVLYFLNASSFSPLIWPSC